MKKLNGEVILIYPIPELEIFIGTKIKLITKIEKKLPETNEEIPNKISLNLKARAGIYFFNRFRFWRMFKFLGHLGD